MMSILRSLLALVGFLAILLALFGFLVIWTGTYDVAADSGQGILDRIAAYTRENSVEARAAGIDVPPLDNPAMIAEGAARYSEMCSGCHLAPGMTDNEMRPGMNPKPPELAKRKNPDPAEDFWIVDHGIKMTAMPAWGLTHSDTKLWELVAFLHKLPGMSVARYHGLVAQGRAAMDGHGHGPAPAGEIPAMRPPPERTAPGPG